MASRMSIGLQESFGFPPTSRREPILSEVFESCNDFVSEAPYSGQQCDVAVRGEQFRRVAGVRAPVIIPTIDIGNVIKTVSNIRTG
jgi:hypothetical protein